MGCIYDDTFVLWFWGYILTSPSNNQLHDDGLLTIETGPDKPLIDIMSNTQQITMTRKHSRHRAQQPNLCIRPIRQGFGPIPTRKLHDG